MCEINTSTFIRNGIDNWNMRNKDAFLADFESDCEITGPGGLILSGRDGAELFWHAYQDAFPDNQVTVLAVLADADAGVEEATFEGTHTGVLRGSDGSQIPASGGA